MEYIFQKNSINKQIRYSEETNVGSGVYVGVDVSGMTFVFTALLKKGDCKNKKVDNYNDNEKIVYSYVIPQSSDSEDGYFYLNLNEQDTDKSVGEYSIQYELRSGNNIITLKEDTLIIKNNQEG